MTPDCRQQTAVIRRLSSKEGRDPGYRQGAWLGASPSTSPSPNGIASKVVATIHYRVNNLFHLPCMVIDA